MSTLRYEGSKRHAEHYLSVLRDASQFYDQGGDAIRDGLNKLRKELGQIQEGQSWAESEADNDDQAAELCLLYSLHSPQIKELALLSETNLRWCNSGLKIAQRRNATKEEGYIMLQKGAAHFSQGEQTMALECYRHSLSIAHKEGDKELESVCHGNMGNAYIFMSKYREAIESFQYSFNVRGRDNEKAADKLTAWQGLSAVYYHLGEYDRAIDYCERVRNIANKIGDRIAEGDALNNLGGIYETKGSPRRAIKYLEQSLSIARDIGHFRLECEALCNLGQAHLVRGDFNYAIAKNREGLEVSRRIGDSHTKCILLGNMAEAHLTLSEFEEATSFAMQQLEFARELQDQYHECRALSTLGGISWEQQQSKLAIPYYENALVILEKIGGNDLQEANLRLNLGQVLIDVGERTEARVQLSTAKKIYQQIDDVRNVALCNQFLSSTKKWWHFWK